MMDIETYADIRELREKVANKLGISMEEYLNLPYQWKLST